MATVSTQPTAVPAAAPAASNAVIHTFPEPSLTLVEFNNALGLLLASRTERDAPNRRIVLKGVGYIRIEQRGWGAAAYPEIWVQQAQSGLFLAIEPKTQRVFRHPSRRRYEVSFLSRDIFECAVQCIKEKRINPLYELVVITFGTRPDFTVESGCLLAPEDYAAESVMPGNMSWVEYPPKT